MEEWKEYKISDVIDEISMGPFGSNIKVDNFIDFGVPVLNGSNLQGFKLNEDSFNYVSQEKADSLGKANAHRGDVVITHRGTLGQIIYIPEDSKYEQYVISQSQFRLKLNQNLIRPDFFVYFFHTRLGQHRILMNASQVGVPALARPTSTFKEVLVPVPPIEVQSKVMDILHSLDDKIEVNRKINENLEQQAQALFKSWFVDFEPFKNGEFVESELGMIPKGWRVVSLDEMTSKFGTGLNPRKNFKLGEGNNYYVTIKNMGNNRVYLDDKCDKVTDDAIEKINKRSKLQEGDLLFSGIGTIGRVALVTQTPTNWNTSESVFNMHPTQNISSEFLYILLLSDVFQQYVKIHAQGGVQQGIRMASLKEYRMAIPEDSLLRKFDDIVMPIISRIKNNDNQSDSLAELRDTLLPKLMSGELRVPDTDLINKML